MASVEYKIQRCEPNLVVALIAEEAIVGWEPVSVYPTAFAGEGTMNLIAVRVAILFKRVTVPTKKRAATKPRKRSER